MGKNISFITVKTQFEATHNYPEAPAGVDFLRNTHRHVFHVEVEVQVFTDDRELEFILVKRNLNSYLNMVWGNGRHLGRCSCEMIAESIQDHIHKDFPLTLEMIETYELGEQIERLVNVRVLEDNENGVYLKQI